jgi:hypothetical protein
MGSSKYKWVLIHIGFFDCHTTYLSELEPGWWETFSSTSGPGRTMHGGAAIRGGPSRDCDPLEPPIHPSSRSSGRVRGSRMVVNMTFPAVILLLVGAAVVVTMS